MSIQSQELYKQHLMDMCTLERYIGVDKTNKRLFSPPVQVSCRIIKRSEVLSTLVEEEVLSSYTVHTWDEIGDKDRINGYDVIRVNERKSLLTGEVFGYKTNI